MIGWIWCIQEKLSAVDFDTFQPLDEFMYKGCKNFMTNEKLSTLRGHIFSDSKSKDSDTRSHFEFWWLYF